ncbi:MAG: hypothetical protein ACKVQW_03355 [Pyrinomonadaceae bacterium]
MWSAMHARGTIRVACRRGPCAAPGKSETADVIDPGQKTATVAHLWLAFSLANFEPNEQSEPFEVIAASKGVCVKLFLSAERELFYGSEATRPRKLDERLSLAVRRVSAFAVGF